MEEAKWLNRAPKGMVRVERTENEKKKKKKKKNKCTSAPKDAPGLSPNK